MSPSLENSPGDVGDVGIGGGGGGDNAGRTFDLQAMRESLAAAERSAQMNLMEVESTKIKKEGEDSSLINRKGAQDGNKGSATKDNAAKKSKASTYVPPKHLLLYLVSHKMASSIVVTATSEDIAANKSKKKELIENLRMGSFTSMSKIIPSSNLNDDDVSYATTREDLETFLKRCSKHLSGKPEPIERRWKQAASSAKEEEKEVVPGENIRVMQWNCLSQALGTKNDNFVRCPSSALEWRTRRFRMAEEIARHDPDVICLQEVDHFAFLERCLSPLGYRGHFFPKPDSPCLYLAENTGPDGCAIFYKTDKFELEKVASRVIEVWSVESNQVVLMTHLRSKSTQEELCVATTHLKARNGALLSTLRNEQGKDILEFVSNNNRTKDVPVIITGDFNAEPEEPVYETMTNGIEDIRFRSAYRAASSDDKESSYTTWKIREDGEHIQTLDYIFYSDDPRLSVESVLDFPTGNQLGEARLPSEKFASDHLSLVADIRLKKKTTTNKA